MVTDHASDSWWKNVPCTILYLVIIRIMVDFLSRNSCEPISIVEYNEGFLAAWIIDTTHPAPSSFRHSKNNAWIWDLVLQEEKLCGKYMKLSHLWCVFSICWFIFRIVQVSMFNFDIWHLLRTIITISCVYTCVFPFCIVIFQYPYTLTTWLPDLNPSWPTNFFPQDLRTLDFDLLNFHGAWEQDP